MPGVQDVPWPQPATRPDPPSRLPPLPELVAEPLLDPDAPPSELLPDAPLEPGLPELELIEPPLPLPLAPLVVPPLEEPLPLPPPSSPGLPRSEPGVVGAELQLA